MFAPFETAVDDALAVLGCVIPEALYGREVFEWLSADDAAALATLRSRRRRAQFAAGRWLLQRAAVRVFGEGCYELRTAGGRPRIAVRGDGPAAVSISHSAGMVLCAAGRVPALGVDVERIRPRHDWARLAALILHPQERAGLDGAGDTMRWDRLYRAWTCKEAIAKALGAGVFALSLERICVGDDGALREAPPEQVPDLARWRLRELDLGEGWAAAVAWRT